MAREKMVTRTVDVALITAMCVNVDSAGVSVNTFEINGLFTNNDDALKAVKKCSETDSFKIVAIQKIEQFERLYGMTEAEFIQYARVLPPRGTKATE